MSDSYFGELNPYGTASTRLSGNFGSSFTRWLKIIDWFAAICFVLVHAPVGFFEGDLVSGRWAVLVEDQVFFNSLKIIWLLNDRLSLNPIHFHSKYCQCGVLSSYVDVDWYLQRVMVIFGRWGWYTQSWRIRACGRGTWNNLTNPRSPTHVEQAINSLAHSFSIRLLWWPHSFYFKPVPWNLVYQWSVYIWQDCIFLHCLVENYCRMKLA